MRGHSVFSSPPQRRMWVYLYTIQYEPVAIPPIKMYLALDSFQTSKVSFLPDSFNATYINVGFTLHYSYVMCLNLNVINYIN